MQALDARNKIAHTYDFKTFEQIIARIQQDYFAVLDSLHLTMLEKAVEEFHG